MEGRRSDDCEIQVGHSEGISAGRTVHSDSDRSLCHNSVSSAKSMQGKEVGQGSGYKLAQLQELEVGSRLVVGGKEVMVTDLHFH